MQFGLGAVLLHSGTPSLRVAGFEDSGSTELAEVLSAVAHALWCDPPKVGLRKRGALHDRRWQRRKDDDEAPGAAVRTIDPATRTEERHLANFAVYLVLPVFRRDQKDLASPNE